MTDRDEGSVTLFVVLFLVSAFLLAGLVIDGGLAIDGRGRAADAAEQAARYGADQIDVGHLRDTGVALIAAGGAACTSARYLLNHDGGDLTDNDMTLCSVSGDGQSITVRVQLKVHTAILGIIGFNDFTVSAQAVAHPVAG
jgi:hypothetical protein